MLNKLLILLFAYSISSAQVVVPFIISSSPGAAKDETKWYVSNDGDDENTGHGESPLQTIAGLMTKTLQDGDSVFFNKGDTWYGESLTITTNNVVVSSYGTGALPIISGGEVLTTWIQNGDVWAAHATSDVYNLFVDEVEQTLARKPNLNTWYRCDAGTTNSLITSADITDAEDALIGARLRVLGAIWSYQNRLITDNTTGTATLASAMSWTPSTNYGFFMEGLQAFIDTAGEFWHNTTTDSTYYRPGSGIDPNDLTIIASIKDVGISTGSNNVVVNGLQIEKQYESGVEFTGTPSDVRVTGCTIKHTSIGISFEGATTYATVNNNIITDCTNRGINIYQAKYSNFEADSIRRIGLVPGKANQPMAIASTDETGGHNVISKCNIDSVGFAGIFATKGDKVDSNVVKNVLLTLDDGGNFYTDADSVTVRNNIFENAIGYVGASGATIPASAVLLYYDAGSSYGTASNNTLKGTANCGIFNQYNSMYNTYTNNMIYDIKSPAAATNYYDRSAGAKLLQSTDYVGWGNLTFNYNVIYSSDTTAYQVWAEQRSDTAEFLDFGDNDYNKYLNPYNQNRQFFKYAPGISYGYMTWQGWKDTTADDANSSDIWRQWYYSSSSKDSLFVNEFDYPINFTIAENTWKDYEGTIHGTTLTVPADSAILLFNSPDSDSLLASYTETNQDADGLMSVANGTAGRAQCFYGDGNYIGGFSAYVKRIGTSGYTTPRLCANVGGATYGGTARPVTNASLVYGDSVATGGFSTSYAWVYFTFQTPYKTVNGTIYFIALTSWDTSSSNCLTWGRDTSSPTDPSNPAYTGNPAAAWSAGTSDQCYKVYTRPSP